MRNTRVGAAASARLCKVITALDFKYFDILIQRGEVMLSSDGYKNVGEQFPDLYDIDNSGSPNRLLKFFEINDMASSTGMLRCSCCSP